MQQADAVLGEPRDDAGGQTQSGRRVGPRPDRHSFLIKKKNTNTEEDKKGDGGGGKKNSGGGGAKRGRKKRVGIEEYVLEEKEGNDYDDANSWDENDFDVGGKEGAEWENNERDKVNKNDEDIEEEEKEGKGDGSQI